MRSAAILMLIVLAAASVTASTGAPSFGATGAPSFREYEVGLITSAPEPTIGIPWNTNSLFYQSNSNTIKGVFDDNGDVTWTDVTPPLATPVNLDPMLIADEDTGRIIAGGLVGPCSVMHYSDDDGATWLPSLNMCSGAQFDHQSVGIGPKPIIGNPDNIPQLQNAYYCGQLIAIGCSVSLDGGETWTAPTPAAAQIVVPANDGEPANCGGFHGHWRISRITGTAFLPVGSCGNNHGMLIANVLTDGTQAAGVTGLGFEGRPVAGSHAWDGGFDPSIGIGRDEGWLYYGQADHEGARMALSKDEGLTWESLGNEVGGTTWVDVGAFHDPPVVLATFADVQAGDDDRAAFTFLGLLDTDGDGLPNEYGRDMNTTSPRDLYQCAPPREDGVENREWHYFSAFTYDAGQTWKVTQMTDHPVQIGGIWDGGGGDPCRNLLDFNDMDIDSQGRIHIAWADGCVGDCLDTDNFTRYSREPRLLRQETGRGLFAEFDNDDGGSGATGTATGSAGGDGTPSKKTPGVGFIAVIGLLGAALAKRRQ